MHLGTVPLGNDCLDELDNSLPKLLVNVSFATLLVFASSRSSRLNILLPIDLLNAVCASK